MKKQFATKADYVFTYLKEKIIKGELKQGERIVISTVAEELNVSSIPVREALKRLETEGLVKNIPHKGAQVSSFDFKKLNEILSIRAVLEGYATRTAIPQINNKLMEKLEKMVDEMRRYAEEEDDESFCIANQEFHRRLYQQCPFPRLYDMIFQLWDGGNWSKSIFAFNPGRMKESVREHQEILQAIKEGDEEKVEKLVRAHKLRNRDLFKKLAEKYNWVTSEKDVLFILPEQQQGR